MIFRHSRSTEAERMRVGSMPAELGIVGTYLEARCSNGHDDRRDLRLAIIAGAGAGRNHAQRGDVGTRVGDELLAAVDHPFMITQSRLSARGTGVGPSLGFGESEGRKGAAGDQIWQPKRLLLLRAEMSEWVDAEADG